MEASPIAVHLPSIISSLNPIPSGIHQISANSGKTTSFSIIVRPIRMQTLCNCYQLNPRSMQIKEFPPRFEAFQTNRKIGKSSDSVQRLSTCITFAFVAQT
jgi:hypothetical protein